MSALFKTAKKLAAWVRHSLVTSMRIGDWLVLLTASVAVIALFQSLWSTTHATKLQIRMGDHIHAVYDLNLSRDVHIHGVLGDTVIQIADGKARFAQSPCHNQYCVHQGWLSRTGQAAICLPNQISLELIGEHKPFDSLNY